MRLRSPNRISAPGSPAISAFSSPGRNQWLRFGAFPARKYRPAGIRSTFRPGWLRTASKAFANAPVSSVTPSPFAPNSLTETDLRLLLSFASRQAASSSLKYAANARRSRTPRRANIAASVDCPANSCRMKRIRLPVISNRLRIRSLKNSSPAFSASNSARSRSISRTSPGSCAAASERMRAAFSGVK